MDMGIAGRRALVCAGSKGLGKGCAQALAREGVLVTITARGKEALEKTADEIRAAGGKVTTVAGDITTPDGRAAALAACKDPDILINNAGGPQPGDFRDWTPDDWMKALNANMITAIELIKATLDPMIARKWGRIVNITSGSVKSPIPVLGLSNGARTGLTGFCAGIARQVAKDGVTINGLLPGPFDTDRLRSGMEFEAKKTGRPLADIVKERSQQNPSKRFGTAEEFGAACAFLCSAHAGYITGQNLLMDGGAFNSSI